MELELTSAPDALIHHDGQKEFHVIQETGELVVGKQVLTMLVAEPVEKASLSVTRVR
ncbi:hypothetical protein [Salinibacter ruber]|uniref:hypothetical protein n=1 Tax=Salinibacter ruber TaxID=146919 RepID=UPI002168485F|nr:hypothetical protein [Salinibacter ruber]MCS4039954.1 hypothetical protein [Salinibacter ruber]